VEIYLPRKPLELDHPEGCCSQRYRDILVKGAEEMALDPAWIDMLRSLSTYTPSAETLKLRAAVPSPSELPVMTIAELAKHNGQSLDHPIYTSVCGYVFEHKEFFSCYHGRDITFRNVLHSRGINMEENDDGGKSPFPRLSQLEPSALEYPLRYRDRFIRKSAAKGPIAVLREFWEEQEKELEGVFSNNTLSKL
jgi:hypothetical protein